MRYGDVIDQTKRLNEALAALRREHHAAMTAQLAKFREAGVPEEKLRTLKAVVEELGKDDETRRPRLRLIKGGKR